MKKQKTVGYVEVQFENYIETFRAYVEGEEMLYVSLSSGEAIGYEELLAIPDYEIHYEFYTDCGLGDLTDDKIVPNGELYDRGLELIYETILEDFLSDIESDVITNDYQVEEIKEKFKTIYYYFHNNVGALSENMFYKIEDMLCDFEYDYVSNITPIYDYYEGVAIDTLIDEMRGK